MRACSPAAAAGLRRELHSLLQGQAEDHRPEPPVHRREPRLRDVPQARGIEGQARRVLAHARLGQELLDDFLRPQNLPQADGQFHVRGRDRPRRFGRADLPELPAHRHRHQSRSRAAQGQRGDAEVSRPEQAAGLHADPEIPLGQRQGLPAAVAAQRHHRDRGRGAPHAIQRPRGKHAGGLKNAQYLAFTGTPLLGRERKTNQWFGDYVSEYNFQQSMDDGATVPLFYKKRVPQVLIQNDDSERRLLRDLEDENLDDAQQAKLENRFAAEIEVIKRDDRLETIAEGHRLSLPAARLSRQRHGGLAGQVHRREDV